MRSPGPQNRYAGTMSDRRDHQLSLRSDQDETVVFKLWPLLLDAMFPALTHAEIVRDAEHGRRVHRHGLDLLRAEEADL
jgi:hypothetical protein